MLVLMPYISRFPNIYFLEMSLIRHKNDVVSVFFYAKIELEREVVQMFTDREREKILSKEELQKLDLLTLSLVLHVIEEVLEEENEDDKQSLSGNTYDK